MRVKVLYFASFREAAGRDTEAREVAPDTRVSDLWQALRLEVPYFRALPTIPPAAVNSEYVESERGLKEGDEVTFLPPVAGG